MPRLPLLYKYHEFYNTLYYISSFANPVLTYRCYVNVLNVEPSNTNKYITGILNKGQLLNRGKGRKRGMIKGGNGGSIKVGETGVRVTGEEKRGIGGRLYVGEKVKVWEKGKGYGCGKEGRGEGLRVGKKGEELRLGKRGNGYWWGKGEGIWVWERMKR